MEIPTLQVAGVILARLAVADAAFLRRTFDAAVRAKDKLEPGELEILVSWARVIRRLRALRINEVFSSSATGDTLFFSRKAQWGRRRRPRVKRR